MLNPNLDRQELAWEFERDGRLRITEVLEPDIAERIHAALGNDVPWEFIYHLDGQHVISTAERMRSMPLEQQKAVTGKVMAAAAEGVGFIYCGYMMQRRKETSGNDNLDFLHSVFDYLNGDEMLDFVREITGRDDIRSADGQYTRYTAGQFLTRHRDDETADQRRLAYIFSFSRGWHPDWGGLLQFYEDDGTPREAWAPRFNTLSLFDIRHVHSVTFVTPFAGAPRLSLTGWFRAVPQ